MSSDTLDQLRDRAQRLGLINRELQAELAASEARREALSRALQHLRGTCHQHGLHLVGPLTAADPEPAELRIEQLQARLERAVAAVIGHEPQPSLCYGAPPPREAKPAQPTRASALWAQIEAQLLQLGEASADTIAQAIGSSRTSVYNCLNYHADRVQRRRDPDSFRGRTHLYRLATRDEAPA